MAGEWIPRTFFPFYCHVKWHRISWVFTGHFNIYITMTSHEGHDISNQWQLDCLFKQRFKLTPKKTLNIRVAYPLCGESIDRWPVMRKTFPLHGVSMKPVISIKAPTLDMFISVFSIKFVDSVLPQRRYILGYMSIQWSPSRDPTE